MASEFRSVRGGRIPGTDAKPAFTLTQRRPLSVPVLVAVPHAGRAYPEAFAASMRFPAQASIRLEDRFTDLVGEAIARETGASLLVAHAPRAMIDLNRSPEDVDWGMIDGGSPARTATNSAGRRARSGLGLVPRRLPGLGEVWKRPISREDLAERVEGVHQPYHATLSRALEQIRDHWGSALLIDLHSMPPLGPKNGVDAAVDFVVGDRFGSSSAANLAGAAFDHFAASRRRAAHNRPYAGGYVLDRHAAPARGIHALQIEMCRTTYLDSQLLEPGPGLASVVQVMVGLVRRMAEEMTGDRSMPQAAE